MGSSTERHDAGQQPRKLVLILDGDPSTATLTSDIISNELNWDAVVFTHSHPALQFIRQKLPDLIVLGVLMPAMDALNFYNSLRADSTTKATPVLFVTTLLPIPATQSPGDLHKLAFVSKPFNVDTFVAVVKALVGRQK